MKLQIKSEVIVPGLGKLTDSHEQTFPDDGNVFGRVADYRQYMGQTFPGCAFRLIEVKEVTA